MRGVNIRRRYIELRYRDRGMQEFEIHPLLASVNWVDLNTLIQPVGWATVMQIELPVRTVLVHQIEIHLNNYTHTGVS